MNQLEIVGSIEIELEEILQALAESGDENVSKLVIHIAGNLYSVEIQ